MRPRQSPACAQLLVNLTVIFNPARRVTFAWIAVCPVHHAAFGVPFIYATERYQIAFAKADHSRCQINVVRDEQCLTRGERNDEALMSTSVVIVREQLSNNALPLHLKVARALLEGTGECLVVAR